MDFICRFFIILFKTEMCTAVSIHCSLCSKSIPPISGQKKVDFYRCDCGEHPIICPHCRRDTTHKPRFCRWCHQQIFERLTCTRSNAQIIVSATRKWLYVKEFFPTINWSFANFRFFANFRKFQDHLFSTSMGSFGLSVLLDRRKTSHNFLKHFSVSFARMLICKMFGEQTTNFFSHKCTIVKQNNELMRMIFQRVIAVLEFMLFMEVETLKLW